MTEALTLAQRLRAFAANSLMDEAADRIEADASTISRLSAELAEARKERDGLALIVNARKKHVDAVATYNARREVLKTVPLGCRNLDIEFRAFSDAQSDFIATAQSVADAFLASKEASQ